jgi:hypothetical protein
MEGRRKSKNVEEYGNISWNVEENGNNELSSRKYESWNYYYYFFYRW